MKLLREHLPLMLFCRSNAACPLLYWLTGKTDPLLSYYTGYC